MIASTITDVEKTPLYFNDIVDKEKEFYSSVRRSDIQSVGTVPNGSQMAIFDSTFEVVPGVSFGLQEIPANHYSHPTFHPHTALGMRVAAMNGGTPAYGLSVIEHPFSE